MSYYISHPETRADPQSLSHCSTTTKSHGFVQPREKIGQILLQGHVDASTQGQAERDRGRERPLLLVHLQQHPANRIHPHSLKSVDWNLLKVRAYVTGSLGQTYWHHIRQEKKSGERRLLPLKVTAVGQEMYLKAFLLADKLYSLITRWNKSQF